MGDLVSYLEGADIEVTLDETAYDRACVPAFIDVALFGIAREAATNIVRHAGARRATLALSTKREGFAELIVDDDGKGLAAPAAAAGHHGLLGHARARAASTGHVLRVPKSARRRAHCRERSPQPEGGDP